MKTTKKDFNCEYIVNGMHCAACELLIEKKLSKVDGVEKVDAKLGENKVYIKTSKDLNVEELSSLVEADGYQITDSLNLKKTELKKSEFVKGFLIAVVIFSIFLIIQKTGIINLNSSRNDVSLPFIFLIGVVASLSTCMAVVGGLVLSLSTNYSKERKFLPMVGFHLSRLVSFFILGGLIGLIGSAATLTPITAFLLNIILFVVMILMAINLLNVFSFSKKLQLKMPKFVGKKVLNLQEKQSYITPVLLGAATFFLPCGFTQSMQLYSLTSGSVLNGAVTMFIFALGTLPVLALISFASVKLSKSLQSGLFFKAAAFIIIFFAIFNLLSAFVSFGLIQPLYNF